MKKIIKYFFILFFLSIISFLVILSTIGIETSKFNTLINNQIQNNSNNLKIKLNSIKFKLDIKKLNLFVETSNPIIKHNEILIPVKNVKIYLDFFSLLKSSPKIERVNLELENLKLKKIKEFSFLIKPSNLKSLMFNQLQSINISSQIEIYLDKNNNFKNFIARGSVSDLKYIFKKKLNIYDTKFNFFADSTDIILNKFNGKSEGFEIIDGDLRMALLPDISISANFLSSLDYKKSMLDKYSIFFKDLKDIESLISFKGDANNNLIIELDKTFKLKKLDISSKINLNDAIIKPHKPINNPLSDKKINNLYFRNASISSNYSLEKNSFNISGDYSFDNKEYSKFSIKKNFDNNISNFDLNIDYIDKIRFDLINYLKPKNQIANLIINLEKKNLIYKINLIKLTSENDSISIKNLLFENFIVKSFDKILVKTFNDKIKNNDFAVLYGKKIEVNGSKFDARNLLKLFDQQSNNKIFSKIKGDIEIDLTNILTPVPEELTNFKLIGRIENGKFTKISSKGDFGNNKFLDISMKKDNQNKRKYLEVYSDLSKPLLSHYTFFNGLTGGNLLFSSVIDEEFSTSKLKIENFKVINAPGMVKLLSLADLGGLADLAKGDGISFDVLEIKMENRKGYLKLDEIYAVGPSISVLMDGYKDQEGLTSLRGTLVPARNLNKLLSKIPVLGDIIIPKEVGEGLFGISFKMKGKTGQIKTSINPIRTLTPRFIQKIIEKSKKSKQP